MRPEARPRENSANFRPKTLHSTFILLDFCAFQQYIPTSVASVLLEDTCLYIQCMHPHTKLIHILHSTGLCTACVLCIRPNRLVDTAAM